MELTLTGGSTLSDNNNARSTTPVHSNVGGTTNNNTATATASSQGNSSHSHNHGHGHHNHQAGAACCNAHPQPRPVVKIDASTLLPSKEAVQRFKTDKIYRMSMLSNIIRGGPYALFIDLMTVLVSNNEEVAKTKTNEEAESILKDADPVALTQMLEGYGNDGHTLAHWCAKRGKYIIRAIFVILHSSSILCVLIFLQTCD